MILELRKSFDPVLKKKSKEVKNINEEEKKFSQDLIETMVKKDGIGIASPQIGVLKKIIVVQTQSGPQVFVNPKIIKKSKETETEEEGCLNFPGIFLDIKRSKRVEVEAENLKQEKIYIKATGLTAKIFQHEIDHLEGFVIVDRVSFLEKLKVKRKLKKINL